MLQFTVLLVVYLPCYFTYTEIPSQDCSHVRITDRKGDIKTPAIKAAVFCKQWFIQGAAKEIITLSFSYINDVCGKNYLVVGSKNRENLCGKSTPHVFISEENHMWIAYYQNTSVAKVGFEAKYTRGRVPSSTSCESDEFECDNDKCIYDSWRCNGADECGDNSDELNCSDDCKPDEFRCSDGNCVEKAYICDGIYNCADFSDERNCYFTSPVKTSTPKTFVKCVAPELPCTLLYTGQRICLASENVCDGKVDCDGETDEDNSFCENRNCNRHIDVNVGGHITTPRYPIDYPSNKDCVWHFQSRENLKIQLRFKDFQLQAEANTDYVAIYDSPNTYSKLIDTYTERNKPPKIIESTSNYLTVVFHSDSVVEEPGFNLTYQNKGSCLVGQSSCGTEVNCYENTGQCDGIWDCPISGQDEKDCGMCKKGLYTCGPHLSQCYDAKQRCNGVRHCTNMMDEMHCTAIQCGPHNGTFLCDNNRCIYETWKCDKTNDCGDNSDERNCYQHVTNLIKIAAVAGALICGLLLVVALGCTCKLYNLRVNGHNRHRHETPLSRLYSEFIRRRAPPPYHEAMITSRSYDDVRRDYLEHLQQTGGRPPSRRGRRFRNRNQPQNTQDNNEGQSPDISDNVENSENNENNPPLELQNSVNIDFERQNSTAVLLLPDSSSDESESDNENQNETVQVSISEENVVTACYRRGSHNNKTDSDNESSCLPSVNPEPDTQSVDVCSMDATIASCDSIDENKDISDKTIDIVVVETIPRRRQNSEESLNSAADSGENSSGEFTIADIYKGTDI